VAVAAESADETTGDTRDVPPPAGVDLGDDRTRLAGIVSSEEVP
jgi:hypothetical protein